MTTYPPDRDQAPATPGEDGRSTLPAVAIVGRPNVGKSALFNRLVRRRLAIVHEQSGVTRDRVSAPARWDDRHFLAIDTGGLGLLDGEKGEDLFDGLIRDQLEAAVEEAACVVFVTDAQAGVMPLDREVADFLRRRGKPVILAPNKADNAALANEAAATFAELAFAPVVPISCTHGAGLPDLMAEVLAELPPAPPPSAEHRLGVAVVGRPNVGKSSVVNRLLGTDRVIVSEVPGTTRDAVDVPFVMTQDGANVPALLVDTAGMRRQRRVDSVVEYFSAQRTQAAIRRADVVIVVMDATAAGTSQDKRICRMVHEAGKACLLLVNKWDLATGQVKQKELFAQLADSLPFMDYASVLTCCAKSGYNFAKIVPALLRLAEQLQVEVPTSLLNRVARDAVLRVPPPRRHGGELKVYYGVCTGHAPPTFLLFVNDQRRCPEHYRRYLVNCLREAFGLFGLPIVLELRNRRREDRRGDGRQPGQRSSRG